MDLLLLTGRFPQRSETFIYRKAVGLANRGHHVIVAARSIGDWSLYPEPLPPTLRVDTLPPDHSLRPYVEPWGLHELHSVSSSSLLERTYRATPSREAIFVICP